MTVRSGTSPEPRISRATLSGEDQPIVLFDGVCNFCNASVDFIIRHDPHARFRFAPLQSPMGEELQRRYNLDATALDTLVLIERGRASRKSTAALRIAQRLRGPYPLLYLLILIPRFIRDFCYDVLARNRYHWFGKRDECVIPSAEVRDRFLVD